MSLREDALVDEQQVFSPFYFLLCTTKFVKFFFDKSPWTKPGLLCLSACLFVCLFVKETYRGEKTVKKKFAVRKNLCCSHQGNLVKDTSWRKTCSRFSHEQVKAAKKLVKKNLPFLLNNVSSFPLRSREEIEMWKEKQRQVKAEEEKTKNTRSVVFDTRTSNLVFRPHAPGGHDIIEEEPWNKHKWVISDVCYRELWTEQAEILIRQVEYFEGNVKNEEIESYR